MKKSLLKKTSYPAKELSNLGIWFQKFCHKKGCRTHDLCPTTCCYENVNVPQLNLHTSAAWLAADEAMNLFETVDSFNAQIQYMHRFLKNPFELKDQIDNLCEEYDSINITENRCDTLKDVTSYHHEKYPILNRKLARLEAISKNIRISCSNTIASLEHAVKKDLEFVSKMMYEKEDKNGKAHKKH
jgi:hypothetical protein